MKGVLRRVAPILVLAQVSTSACSRTLVLRLDPQPGSPAWVSSEEPAPEPLLVPYLSPVDVAPTPPTSLDGKTVIGLWRDDDKARVDAEWRRALAAQPYLGPLAASERQSDYTIKLRSAYRMDWGTRTGMAVLAGAIAVATTAAGIGVGYAVERAAGGWDAGEPGGGGGGAGLAVGELVGLGVGVVVALALPTHVHEHAWTTEMEVWDRDQRLLAKRTSVVSNRYTTSVLTDSDEEHRRRASALFRASVADGLLALEAEAAPALRRLSEERAAVAKAEAARREEARRAAEPRRVSVAVLDLSDPSRVLSRKLVGELTDYLRARLAASGRFVVIDKTRQEEAFKRVLREQQKCRFTDVYAQPGCQIPLGQAVSADAILRASVNRVGSFLYFKAELVDLAREAAVAGATSRCAASPAAGREDRMMHALDEAVDALAEGPR